MKKALVVVLLAASMAHAKPKKVVPVVQEPDRTNILWGTGVIWGDSIWAWLDNILWGT